MNHLRLLTDRALHEKLMTLSAEERRLTLEILHHLREVESRRLFATRGHSSLFEYVTRELGYSESSALRRISAMRALKGLPEMEAKVESGELKVSQLAQVQAFIRQEKKAGKIYDQDRKRELLLEVAGKSARETEKVLAERNPEIVHRDRIRVVTPEWTQITFTADEGLIRNLDRIRDVFAHELPPGATHADLIRWMSDKLLHAHEKKMQGPKRSQSAPSTSEVDQKMKSESEPASKATSMSALKSISGPILKAKQKRPPLKQPSRYIPASVKREVWKRDQGQCVYVSPVTGRICGSRHLIQYDHRRLFSRGGPSTVENLRLLCHAHNQSEARRVLGVKSRS